VVLARGREGLAVVCVVIFQQPPALPRGPGGRLSCVGSAIERGTMIDAIEPLRSPDGAPSVPTSEPLEVAD
jgi:hypothetical protein